MQAVGGGQTVGWIVEEDAGLVWEVGEVLGQAHWIQLLKGLQMDLPHGRIQQDWLTCMFSLYFFRIIHDHS